MPLLCSRVIPKTESDWTSLGHMITPWTDEARHLTDSSTHGKEAALEKEIRVLYQKKEAWILGGEK